MSDRIENFATEAELVAAFCEWQQARRDPWTVYHETAGWDLLLVHPVSGVQIGIEAKLTLNAKVVSQGLARSNDAYRDTGPHYRAVLVPEKGIQRHMAEICHHVGLTVLTVFGYKKWRREDVEWQCNAYSMPDEYNAADHRWHNWCPTKPEPLPDYVPDVSGGKASPVALTQWKIKAIKLLILLERRGVVHRSDMKALQISPTRWTDHYYGFLAATPNGYVACDRTPDLKTQHPRNWSEIEADFDTWNPYKDALV